MEELIRNVLYDPVMGKIVTLAIGFVLLMVGVKLAQKGVSRYVPHDETRFRIKRFVRFIGYAGAVVLAVVVFSDQLGGVAVALGVAGAGIAFALQEVIASVAGWVAVSLGRFYKTGDRVQLGGIKGDVVEIGLLRTTLMEVGEWVQGDLYNGRVVRVANSFVFKEPVFNYSGEFPFLWDEIRIPVRYGSDHRLAQKLLEKVAVEEMGDDLAQVKKAWEELASNYLIEDSSLDPSVTLIANDNWMELTLRFVVDYRRRRTTKHRLYVRILDELDRTQGKVKLASQTFELVGLPPQSGMSGARPRRSRRSKPQR